MEAVLSSDSVADTLAGLASRWALDDDVWRQLGFRRRPRRGRVFERFEDPAVVARERFLVHEFLAIALVEGIRALCGLLPGSPNTAILARALSRLVDGPEPSDCMWKVLAFPSRESSIDFFRDSMRRYLSTDSQGYTTIFVQRFTSILGANLRSDEWAIRWTVGAASLFTSLGYPEPRFRYALANYTNGKSIQGKVTLNDVKFYETSKQILESAK